MMKKSNQYSHLTTCRVLYGDTDSGGVVYYGNYYRYFEIGRTELMRDLVCSYQSLEAQGMILPVVESYCRYKAPGRYDDLLAIETSLTTVSKVSCRFNYRIRRQDDGKLLVSGHTVHAPVNREGRLIRFSPDLLEQLRKVQQKMKVA